MRGFNLLFTENKFLNSMTPSSSSKENSNKNLGGKDVPQGLGVIIALRQIQRGTKALNNLFILRGKYILFDTKIYLHLHVTFFDKIIVCQSTVF